MTAANSSDRLVPQNPRYQVVERLGEGGMAVVYRAVDNEQRRWCAMKVLLPHYRNNPVVRSRFEAEAAAMLVLKHRYVIDVYDAHLDDPEPFFVMELATGGSLVDWLAAHQQMPPRMAVDVVIQVCKALRAAHDQGLIHRDVKPHNVLVNHRGVIKLIDFGIARHDGGDGLTIDGSGLGTLGYIAPEQKDEASRVDERADVYSTGATLHTLLTGRTMLNLYLSDQEPEMLEGVPEPLQPLIIRATRYRSDDRFQSVSEFAKALYEARSSLPDDPEDTPPLVTHHDRDDDEELERFISQPPVAVSQTELADNEDTSSHPSLSRRALLRPAEEIEAARRERVLNLKNMAIGSLPLWALLFAFTLLIFMRAASMKTSALLVGDYQQRLAASVQAERPLVDELVRLGADGERLRHTWTALERAEGRQRTTHAYTVSLLAAQEYAAHEPSPETPEISVARSAEQRIKRLTAATEGARLAEAQDDEVRANLFSRISIRLGLAPPPPP